MASSAEVVVIDGLLDVISAEVRSLRDLEKTWSTMSGHDRFVWDVEWTESMARLQDLEQSQRVGAMTPGQERRYRESLWRLKLSLSILRHLDLAMPTVDLNDVEAA